MPTPLRGSEEDLIPVNPSGPRILTIDIETSPNLAYVWGLFNENIPLARLVESTEVLCFAAKWYDEKKVQFFSTYAHGKETMVKEAHNLVDEADILIHYNGKRFDYPHLSREWLLAHMPPPSPTQQIDLYSIGKSRFRFPSHKLEHIVRSLGMEGKVSKGVDFELWTGCMDGDPQAWATMEKYNKQDVKITERVFDRMRPWIGSSILNFGLYTGQVDTCVYCGSDHIQKRGVRNKGKSIVQQYACMESDCGGWFTDNKALAKTTFAGII